VWSFEALFGERASNGDELKSTRVEERRMRIGNEESAMEVPASGTSILW
jgi:hypothetical protein